jgi:hypothetical protein
MAQFAMIAGTILSANAQYQAGKAQAKGYEMQARQAVVKGKQDELKYKQQGLEVLKKTNATMASVTARAAAGGMDAYSGSPQALRQYARATGTEEYYLTEENAILQDAVAKINETQFMMAAKNAKWQGTVGALTTLAMGTAQAMSMGGSAAGAGGSGGNAMGTSGFTPPSSGGFTPTATVY